MAANNVPKTTEEQQALENAAKQLRQQRKDLRARLRPSMSRLRRLARKSS
jgi:hypothetical protein